MNPLINAEFELIWRIAMGTNPRFTTIELKGLYHFLSNQAILWTAVGEL